MTEITPDHRALCCLIAERQHRGQLRRGGAHYINHPYDVASQFNGMKEPVEFCVAMLHDVIEDTGITAQDLLAEGVPQVIVDAVVALTKNPNNSSYVDYLNQVRKNDVARRVKLADIAANLADNPTVRQARKYANAILILTIDEARKDGGVHSAKHVV